MKMHNNYYEQGINLLELLIVIAVIGIAAMFAVPNFNNFTLRHIGEKDLGTIRTLVDYAKTTSFTKGKTMILQQTNKNTLQMQQHTSKDPRACLGNVSSDDEYPNPKNLKSNILAKHDNNTNDKNTYIHSTSRICFYQDGTTSGGGFEIKYKEDEYRMNIWQTGFYDCTRKIKGSWRECN